MKKRARHYHSDGTIDMTTRAERRRRVPIYAAQIAAQIADGVEKPDTHLQWLAMANGRDCRDNDLKNRT